MELDRKAQQATAAIERRRAVSATVQHSGAATARPPARTLQERLGNQATQLFIAHLAAPSIQRKPSVRAPDDPLERQADIVADQVLRMSAHNGMQRACKECKEEKEEPARIHRVSSAPSVANVDVSAAVHATQRSGAALPADVRSFFEPRFGHDFSGVRVHMDGEAARASRGVEARAYTMGRDIVFGAHEYAPGTAEGRRLLAHELAHVVQQGHAEPILQRRIAPELVHVTRVASPHLALKPNAPTPHYPSAEEQKEIERLLGRDKPVKPRPAQPTTAGATTEPVMKPDQPAETRGRSLTHIERMALIGKLERPFWETILEKDHTAAAETPLSEKEAFEEIEKARKEVLNFYSKYVTHGITITRDQRTTVEERRKTHKVLIHYKQPEAAGSWARTILDGDDCGVCADAFRDLNEDSTKVVKGGLLGRISAKHGEQLNAIARKNVAGVHHGDDQKITIRPRARAHVYGDAVHEFIHNLAHPAFSAAFDDERNIIEGFTEYLTREVAPSSRAYRDFLSKTRDVHAAMTGPFFFPIGGAAADESMRLAYFQGRLDLIGWKPSTSKEEKAVQEKGGSGKWDPAKAKTEAAKFKQYALQQQSPHLNVLGIGIYYTPISDNLLSVSYARVLKSSTYARGQLLLEGQLLGSPEQKPKLSGSFGIIGEYQEPWFYLRAGARVIGIGDTATHEGRVDFAPFGGVGFRLWQRIRVGAEGMVLLPIDGRENVGWGAGGTVSIELGKRD